MTQAPDRTVGVTQVAPVAAPATTFQNDNQYTGEAASAPYLDRIDVFQRWRQKEGVPLRLRALVHGRRGSEQEG